MSLINSWVTLFNGILVQGLLVWSITNKRQLSRPIRVYLKSITFINVESNSFYFDQLSMKVKAYGVNEVLNTAYHIINFYKEFKKIWFCFMVFEFSKAYRSSVTYLLHCAYKKNDVILSDFDTSMSTYWYLIYYSFISIFIHQVTSK